MRRWFALILLSAATASVHGSGPECIARHTATRLATLEVATCLYGHPAEGTTPARAIELRQTLTNVSDRPIELVLSQDPLRRFAPFVWSDQDRRHLHKVPHYPGSEDEGFVEPPNEYVRLKPRASTELRFRIVDVMTGPPGASVRYSVSAGTAYDFRRDGERRSDRDTTRARFDEEAARGRVKRALFSGVGIAAD